MSDSYLNFANTKFGSKLASMLGLPKPVKLERYQVSQTTINGNVLLGCIADSALFNELNTHLSAISAKVYVHRMDDEKASQPKLLPNSNDGGLAKARALAFDASELSNSADTVPLHQFFNRHVRSIEKNGRLLIVGRPPELCGDVKKATVQRSLEGLVRSLAKELRGGITAQLLYVANGAEASIESSLRFLLSPKSAYVSGQVIRLSQHIDTLPELNWQAPLHGKRVLVTGASRGIGLSIAEVMARDGAHVVCLDIPQATEAVTAVAKRLNGSQITLDISHEDAPKILCEAAKANGGWDVIVHNAGITRDKTIAKMSTQQWSQVVNINLSAQERINQALLDAGLIKTGGRIVCVSSISGIAGNRGQTNYALSKAGVIGMVDAYAPLLVEQGITINAVAPGFIETDMTSGMPFAVREAGRRLNSLSQGGQPTDVAEAIAWFANPASSALNGNVLRVCGQSLIGA